MLNLQSTRIYNSDQMDTVSGIVIPDEGVVLTYAKENGVTKTRPSQGIAGEIFAGFSFSRNVVPTVLPNFEKGSIPASLTVNLQRAPMSGKLLVKVDGVTKTVVTAPPADATEVMIAGKALAFYAGEAAKSWSVQYMYEPTVSEAVLVTGSNIIGGMAFQSMHSVGVITRGTVSTSFFDASVDWSNALQAKTGPNGTLTTTGNGTTIPMLVVQTVPNIQDAFLGVRIGGA